MLQKSSKPSSHQPSFLKRQVHQMPDCYSSSGPNPNLRSFVVEHTTPYDPGTDTYKVKPTTKATAIYNMHSDRSKQPHDTIRECIKHYAKPGDFVLDLFYGSGCTTNAIDLSSAAFTELQRKVKLEMDWLYETRCDRYNGRATAAYTVCS